MESWTLNMKHSDFKKYSFNIGVLCLAVYLIAIVVSSKQTIILEPYAVLGINEAVITFTATKCSFFESGWIYILGMSGWVCAWMIRWKKA